jgi:hypothetical protein
MLPLLHHDQIRRGEPQTFTQKLSGGELMGNLFASSILDHNLSLIKDNGIVQIRQTNE